MKRLNKKGFTLIELLAVIVILAVVMVVTIPSVLNSMGSARQKQLENAVHSIEEYVQKNYDICISNLSNEFNDLTYDSSVFGKDSNNNVECTSIVAENAITAAGYKTADIPSITFKTISNNKIEIDTVYGGVALSSGKFKGAKYPNNS